MESKYSFEHKMKKRVKSSSILHSSGCLKTVPYGENTLSSDEGFHLEDSHIHTDDIDEEYGFVLQCSTSADSMKETKEKSEYFYKNLKNIILPDVNSVAINENFVTLKIEETNLMGRSKGNTVDLKELIRKRNDHQTILLTGEPGYGKTTICKKILHDWTTNRNTDNYLHSFTSVIFIPLSTLSKETLYQKVTKTISPNSKEKSALNILLILDDFDEYFNKSAVLKFINEDSVDISQRMTILITCRPHTADEIRKHIDYRYYIQGFSQEQREVYVQLILEKNRSDYKSLIEQINMNEYLNKLAECPLMLHFICCVFNSKNKIKMENMTHFYIELFSFLIEKYVQKYEDARTVRLCDGNSMVGENILSRLGKLLEYYPLKRKTITKHFNEQEREFIRELHILTTYSASKDDDDTTFDLKHRTFYEFLYALHLYKSGIQVHTKYLRNISENMLKFLLGFLGNNPSPEELARIVKCRTFHWKFMTEARKTLSDYSWKLLCTEINLTFDPEYSEPFQELLNGYKFTKFTLKLPLEYEKYRSIKENMLNYLKLCKFSSTLQKSERHSSRSQYPLEFIPQSGSIQSHGQCLDPDQFQSDSVLSDSVMLLTEPHYSEDLESYPIREFQNELTIYVFSDLSMYSKILNYFDFREEMNKIIDLITTADIHKWIFFCGICCSETETYYDITNVVSDKFPEDVILEFKFGKDEKVIGLIIENRDKIIDLITTNYQIYFRFILLINYEQYKIVKDKMKFKWSLH